jgi:hypothetical protein
VSVASAVLLAWSLVPALAIAAALALAPWIEDADERSETFSSP